MTKGSGRIETFEWSLVASQLNTVITLLAQMIHVTAQKGAPKGKQKKFKPPKLTWPATAVEGLKARMRAQHEQATKTFMAKIEFVPEAEYLAEIAENEAAERALAEADDREADSLPDG